MFRVAAPVLILAAFALPAHAHGHHYSHGNSTISGRNPSRCSDIDVSFDDENAVRAESTLTIPVSPSKALRLEASADGGVWVIGEDRAEFSIDVCKAASNNDGDGAQLLAGISAANDAGTVRVSGPSRGEWTAHLIVHAPRAAAISVNAENGPVSFAGLSGAVSAEVSNGPLNVVRCSGSVKLNASNGPLSLREISGHLTADVQNGPVSLTLSGSSDSAGSIDVRGENGPLSLKVDPNFKSGVLVTMGDDSPFHCSGDACDRGRREWEDGRRRTFRLGDGEPSVRIETNNGPVSIRSLD